MMGVDCIQWGVRALLYADCPWLDAAGVDPMKPARNIVLIRNLVASGLPVSWFIHSHLSPFLVSSRCALWTNSPLMTSNPGFQPEITIPGLAALLHTSVKAFEMFLVSLSSKSPAQYLHPVKGDYSKVTRNGSPKSATASKVRQTACGQCLQIHLRPKNAHPFTNWTSKNKLNRGRLNLEVFEPEGLVQPMRVQVPSSRGSATKNLSQVRSTHIWGLWVYGLNAKVVISPVPQHRNKAL